MTDHAERTMDGIPVSGGIAIGQVYILAAEDLPEVEDRRLDDEEVEIEIERLDAAIDEADRVLLDVERIAREDIDDRAGIFEALRMMIRDPALRDPIRDRIVERRTTARGAIDFHLGSLAAHFEGSSDETIRSRAEDIRSLRSHLVAALLKTPVVHRFHHEAVLVLTTLPPTDTILYARNGATAFVLEEGGINSHAAILARALGIPMIAGLKEVVSTALPHETAIVDGYTGRLVLSPSTATTDTYTARKNELEAQRAKLQAIRDLPAETTDGVRICLAANIDMVDELAVAAENGAEEIGLMRTEYLVMGRTSDVPLDEQIVHYRQIAERAFPLTVTLRAFDIGSDKLHGEQWGKSSPLGLRGARLLLTRPLILRRQIEATLRASATRNMALMLPMVTSVDEMRAFRRLVDDAKEVLRRSGTPFDEAIRIGTMIETPAAAMMADALAAESDFLSIGSNDLVQYTLAVDRNDEALSLYYDELHPAIIRLLQMIVTAADAWNKPLTLCGELAARTDATPLLIGLGIRRLSVSPLQLAPLKERVRSVNAKAAAQLAARALEAATGDEVRKVIRGGERD